MSLFRPQGEPDLLRFTTAGHVDDGKSTMIGRLLHDAGALPEDHVSALQKARRHADGGLDFSLVTDGLTAEREGGITIDVAYRYFSTPKRRFIIADTPGHEQYTRNMVTGASTADLAVVLVDVREGVHTQSKRHGLIASLLGVPRLVVAVNKMDLVGYEEDPFSRIKREYSEFAGRLGFSDLTFIPMSALKGDNVVHKSPRMPWYEGTSLLSFLENVYVAGDRNLVDFRLPVQRVVRADREFRGCSGQIASGVVRPGDEIVVLPSGARSRVTRLVSLGGDLAYAFAPLSVTLCLEHDLDIGRGDMIAHPNNAPRMERGLDAMIVWMNDDALRRGRTFLIKHTSRVVRGSCAEITYRIDASTLHRETATELGLNDIGRVRLTLFNPLYVDEYRRNRATGGFIVIDPLTNATVGAGMVLDRVRAGPPLRATEVASSNIAIHTGHVTERDHRQLMKQEAATIWLTGLSGSGKSSIAFELERRLIGSGHACFVLDGDNVRHGLNRDLGFSPNDRRENIRRIAEVARLFNDAGLFVITAFISPYGEDRDSARAIIGEDRFIETWLDADLSVCERRDAKGLYAKARAGLIPDFTGISAPYEQPYGPALTLATGERSVEECVEQVLAFISGRLN